jgi:hypothetical protein
MENIYNGSEHRKFVRLAYTKPLFYKVCKQETISKLLQGYTANVSQSGVLCNIKDRVHEGDVLWVSFERNILHICEELEKRSLIYQNGIIGKVARIEDKVDGTFDVGVQFITREEKNATNIYTEIHFLKAKFEREKN